MTRELFTGARRAIRAGHVYRDMIRDFDPLTQELCLSLLGPAAWRDYRQTAAPATLLLDMHLPDDPFRTFIEHAIMVIALLPQTPAYATIENANAAIVAGAAALTEPAFRVTAENYYAGLLGGAAVATYNVPSDDSMALRIGALAHFVVDCMDPTYHQYGADLMAPWLRVWLDFCDAAYARLP